MTLADEIKLAVMTGRMSLLEEKIDFVIKNRIENLKEIAKREKLTPDQFLTLILTDLIGK